MNTKNCIELRRLLPNQFSNLFCQCGIESLENKDVQLVVHGKTPFEFQRNLCGYRVMAASMHERLIFLAIVEPRDSLKPQENTICVYVNHLSAFSVP